VNQTIAAGVGDGLGRGLAAPQHRRVGEVIGGFGQEAAGGRRAVRRAEATSRVSASKVGKAWSASRMREWGQPDRGYSIGEGC